MLLGVKADQDKLRELFVEETRKDQRRIDRLSNQQASLSWSSEANSA